METPIEFKVKLTVTTDWARDEMAEMLAELLTEHAPPWIIQVEDVS